MSRRCIPLPRGLSFGNAVTVLAHAVPDLAGEEAAVLRWRGLLVGDLTGRSALVQS